LANVVHARRPAALNSRWRGGPTRVHYIGQYYDYAAVDQWLAGEGIEEVSEGIHDGFAITAIMMTVDPNLVRMSERVATGKFSINGVELAPAAKTIELGKKVVEFRADATVKAIEKAIGARRKGK
jgi:hypothetical protein